MEKNTEQTGKNVINVNVSTPQKPGEGKGANKYVLAIKDTFGFITNTSVKSIFKVAITVTIFLLLFLSFKFAYNAVNSEEFITALAEKIEKNNLNMEEAKLGIRTDNVTPKIQKELEMLCYTLNADRAFIFELHNGKKNATGLPFRYADMSYEEPNEEKNVERVAMQFQDIPLTLYRYPHYLAEHKYIFGGINEISLIDNGFACHIEKIGGKFLGMLYLTSRGFPLGFLCVSFHESPQISEDIIKVRIEQYGKIITPLLDLTVQLKEQ